MELITIRGKKDGGKTTTAAMVYSAIICQKNAKRISFILDKGLATVNRDDGSIHDFQAVLELHGKIIAIISARDGSIWLKEKISDIERITAERKERKKVIDYDIVPHYKDFKNVPLGAFLIDIKHD